MPGGRPGWLAASNVLVAAETREGANDVEQPRDNGAAPVPDDVLDGIGWVLWSGTIGLDSPLADRLSAARAAGFSRVSLGPGDVLRAAEEGSSPADVGRRFGDAGLELVMDGVMNWYGTPWNASPMTAVSCDEALRMCESLPAFVMTAIGQPGCDLPLGAVAEEFGRLCDRAADIGVQVQLEFMPMLPIGDLASAWSIVEASARPNGGLLVDTWHFFRSGPDFSTLEKIPGDRIFGVQISDAVAEPSGPVAEETFYRLLPGDGELDLDRVVAELDRCGGLRWAGPEVISPVTAAMDPSEAASLAGARVRGLISAVRSP